MLAGWIARGGTIGRYLFWGCFSCSALCVLLHKAKKGSPANSTEAKHRRIRDRLIPEKGMAVLG